MQAKLTEDYVEVSITKGTEISTEYHAAVIRHEGEKFKPHTRESLNIALIMYDCQSHSNVQRYMKKTYEWLKNDPNTHIFKGRTIVGDATTPQLLAMLTNLMESEAPEARRGHEGAQPVDRYFRVLISLFSTLLNCMVVLICRILKSFSFSQISKYQFSPWYGSKCFGTHFYIFYLNLFHTFWINFIIKKSHILKLCSFWMVAPKQWWYC